MNDNDEFFIEKILDRKGRKGHYEYHCKWLDYDSDENTWEKRADLISDGFESQVEKYDKAHDAKKKKRKSSSKKDEPKKGRSKTPVKRTPKKAPAKKSPANTPTPASPASDDDVDQVRAATPVTKLTPTASKLLGESDESDMHSFIWTWLVAFLIFAVLSIVFYAIEPQVQGLPEQSRKILSMGSLVASLMPMLLSFRTIIQNSSSDFANTAAVTVVWIAMTKFIEMSEAQGTTWDPLSISMAFWTFFMLTMLHQHDDEEKESDNKGVPSWALSVFSGLGYAASLFAVMHHCYNSKYSVSIEVMDYATVFLVFASLVRAFARLVLSVVASRAPMPASHWIELAAVVASGTYIMISLIEENEHYKGSLREWFQPNVSLKEIKIDIPMKGKSGASTHTVVLPMFRIMRDMLAWTASAGLTVSAVVYHG